MTALTVKKKLEDEARERKNKLWRESIPLTKSGKITIYTEIIQRCGMCVGRTDDAETEKILAKVAQVLSSALEKEFKQKEKDE